MRKNKLPETVIPQPGVDEAGLGYLISPQGDCYLVGGAEEHVRWLRLYGHLFSPLVKGLVDTELISGFLQDTGFIRVRHLLTKRFNGGWRRDVIFTLPNASSSCFMEARAHFERAYASFETGSSDPNDVSYFDINVGLCVLELTTVRFIMVTPKDKFWLARWKKDGEVLQEEK